MTTRTSDFDPRGLFFEREIALTSATLQLCWAMVNPSDQNLGARWAGKFLLLPLPSSQRVVNAHFRIAQGAIDLTQTHGQHAFALGARECRWRDF